MSDSVIPESVKVLDSSDAVMGNALRFLYETHADFFFFSEGNDKARPQGFGYPRHSSSSPTVGALIWHLECALIR